MSGSKWRTAVSDALRGVPLCARVAGAGPQGIPAAGGAGGRFAGATTRLLLASLAIITTTALAGCVQKMANEPRYEPYEASALFANGASARPIPAGAVPRSGLSSRGTAGYDVAYETGYDDGRPLEDLPARLAKRDGLPELLARGRERFAIYCSPCHGLAGDGDGMVARRGFPFPPSYHTDRLRSVPIGYIYGVASAGHGRMPSYAAQIPPDDRWAIAAYVHALQLSRHVPASELPEADRLRLPEVPR